MWLVFRDWPYTPATLLNLLIRSSSLRYHFKGNLCLEGHVFCLSFLPSCPGGDLHTRSHRGGEGGVSSWFPAWEVTCRVSPWSTTLAVGSVGTHSLSWVRSLSLLVCSALRRGWCWILSTAFAAFTDFPACSVNVVSDADWFWGADPALHSWKAGPLVSFLYIAQFDLPVFHWKVFTSTFMRDIGLQFPCDILSVLGLRIVVAS